MGQGHPPEFEPPLWANAGSAGAWEVTLPQPQASQCSEMRRPLAGEEVLRLVVIPRHSGLSKCLERWWENESRISTLKYFLKIITANPFMESSPEASRQAGAAAPSGDRCAHSGA